MHKYLALTKVLTKNSLGMLSDGKSKNRMQLILYIILGICCIPMIFVFYVIFDYMMDAMVQLHQEGTLIALGFHLANLITFVFSIFLIPSVFYFSKDSETLLSLPLKPQTILASKFTVCLLYEYAFTLAVAIPLLIAFAQHMVIGIPFLLFSLIIVLTLPIFPLILSSLISMLVMRFVPFFKNRDRFNMIGGILAVVLAFGFSYFTNSQSMQNTTPDQLVQLIVDNNGLISFFAILFPGIPFAARALADADFLQMAIYLIILLAAGALFLFIGKIFYFKGAIGFNETGSNRQRMSDTDMKKVSRKRNKVFTYMMKEFHLLLRTPVYFLNCIATSAIMPIVLCIVFFTSGQEFNEVLPSIAISFQDAFPYAVLVGLVGGLLFSNLNLISATAISREGTNVQFMKYIPMEIRQQIDAKTGCGIIVSILSMLFMVIVAACILPFLPIGFYVICFLSSIITCIFGNYVGILIDMIHPKLVWEQEAAAVKQNMAATATLLVDMACCVLLGYCIMKLPAEYLMITTILTAIIFLLLAIALRFYVLKKSSTFMERIL